MQVAQSNFKKVAGEGAGDVEVLDEQFESEHDESRGASGSDTEPSPSPVREPRQPTSKDLGHGQRSFRDVPAEEIRELKAEGAVAKSLGLKWEQRGPPGPSDGGPATWRGQRYRPNTGQWANNGGRNKEFYTWFYSFKKGARMLSKSILPPLILQNSKLRSMRLVVARLPR